MSITTTTHSPHVKLRTAGWQAAQWTDGFWANRQTLCRDVMVPAMGELMTGSERYRYVGNFEVACGLVEGRHRGPKWNDGDFYKWLEAAAAVYARSKDAALDQQMDELIALIAQTQEKDGYIHTDVQIAQRAGQPTERFGNAMDFEMYNMGHLISAGCVHFRATGKRNLLNLATAAADFLDTEFAHPTPDRARHGICPSHLMGLVELFRTTSEPRYLALATKLFNMRELVTKGDDDNQDRIPFREQTTAHGHAVRATYLYAGAADIYAETGDRSLLEPMQQIWNDLVSHKLYITGGCGALFDGASPDGAIDQLQITRVHQAFGREFQLPHSTAHNETCAAIGNFLWNWRLLQITGEARFADLMELTLFNSVLTGISLDGAAFFYTNTLRQLSPMPVELRWNRSRQKTLGCYCCPPNVVRTIAELSEYAYAVDEAGVSVILYGSNSLDTRLPGGQEIRLTQQTNYPWDGNIRFTIKTGGDFHLSLRLPAWAKDPAIFVNGKQFSASAPGTFCRLHRTWKTGDVVELSLPMPAQIVQAHPYVEETRNQAALMRGPVVYCVESVDLPPGVRVLDVLLPRIATFTLDHTEDLLPGLVALQTRALASHSAEWSGALYRPVSAEKLRTIDLRLVPYFAWDNRGTSEMSVWIPLAVGEETR